MTTSERETLRIAARVALAGAIAASLVAGGCGGESETEAAVNDATILLTTGDGSGGSSESMGALRKSQYQQAATDLAGHVGDEGFASAAAVLAGIAHQGLGAESFTDLVGDIAEARRRLTVIRGSARAWRTHRALADAASTFDPQPRVAALDELEATLKSDLEQARRVSSLVEQQIAEFESRVAEADANAAGERNLAGELRLESSRRTATEAAEMAERIREHTRRADRYEFEARRLRTRAEQLRPDAVEKAAHIERIEEQLALVEASRSSVAERTRSSARHRSEAMASAGETRSEIVDQLEALESFLGNELETSRGDCERQLRQAVSTAAKAGKTTSNSASLVRASASQRLGEMHESLAALHASIADALEHMIEIGLDEDGAMQRLAEGRRQKESDARESAASAYADAAGALRRVRVRGETKQRLDELADRLEGIEPEPTPEDFGGDLPDDAGEPATDGAPADAFPIDDSPVDEGP